MKYFLSIGILIKENIHQFLESALVTRISFVLSNPRAKTEDFSIAHFTTQTLGSVSQSQKQGFNLTKIIKLCKIQW
jgi:hypothetical protein